MSLAVGALLLYASAAAAQTLAWNPNPETNIAGYRIQWGPTASTPSYTTDVGNATTYTFTNLMAGKTYYFRVVAYNTAGLVSNPSAQVSYTTPGTTPSTVTLSGVSPASGPTGGGTTITLTGTNFVSGATVRVGGAAATAVSFVSATQLRANTPAGTAGARDVVVTNPNGQSATRAGGFTYTSTAGAPTLTSVSPTSGPTGGGTTITLTGTNFVSGATVRVGGAAATAVTFVSATQLRANTPAGTAGARDVVVTNPSGQSVTRAGGFTYTGTAVAPTLTSVSPASGPTGGATTITLTGTNFVSGATVRVGGAAATAVTFVSATQLRATTPAGTAGARDVVVTNPSGQSATRTGGFTYTASSSVPPTFTLITPTSGPTSGGTTVLLTGSEFVAGMTVLIGGNAATNVVVYSANRLTVSTPAGTVGAKDVTVRAPSGQSVTVPRVFTYTSTTTSTQTSTYTSYLAEGVQTSQMNTQLAIANAGPADAQATLTFMDANGQETAMAVDVPARSRQTVDLASVPQLAGQTFSTRIDANQPVAVDRLVALDAEGGSASLETAVDRPSATWFFAEGSTADPMELFYLVQNPGTTPAKVQVRYLLPDGAPVTHVHEVAAGSRATIWVDREDAALGSTDVAAEITSLDGTPIVVERSLYVKQDGSAQPRGGDTSTGVTAPATSWFAEAATGPFAARLLLANPGGETANVRATYQLEDGGSVVRTYTVAPGSRRTVDVAAEDPSLADAQLGVKVESSAPIVVERSKWWGAAGQPDEAVSGTATATGGSRWLLAEAEQGGARQAATDVVVFNRGAATEVTVTLLFEDAPEVAKTFPVAAGARFAVPMAEAFPDAAGRRFSVLVEGADRSANLVVDRAIFWQATDGSRTAGADGAAVRLK